MKTTFISTSYISSATRSSLMKVQAELAEAQKEVTTGRLADVGKTLGFKTGQTISLRQEHTRLTTIVETNSIVSTRLEASQASLQAVVASAETFVGQLLASSIDGANASVLKTQAASGLDAFIDTTNTSMNNAYLFSGVNSDAKPLTDYYETPAPANKAAVDAAFFAHFGFTQADPNVANITAADMENFLDTTFAAVFDDPAWTTNWSSASTQNVRNRISTNELIETSVNANDQAFRKLAMSYTMVADLGLEGLGAATYETLVNRAVSVSNEAIYDFSGLQAKLGVAQQRTSEASDRMSIQVDVLATQVSSLEGVDRNEAAVRVYELLTQMESSYALTARIMGLSILNEI
jgi:flagellar hook-associated protein 3 FlgL